MLQALVRLTRRGAIGVPEFCNHANTSERKLRAFLPLASEQGYRFKIKDGYLSRQGNWQSREPVIGTQKPGWHKVAIATDLHFGSTYCDHKGLSKFLQSAWDAGARVCVCTGDILDGNKPVLLPEQDLIGFDHQADQAVATFAKAPPFEFLAIDGNHDGYFSASSGFTSGEVLEARMRAAKVKWSFLGACLGHATIHGAKWQLWHPHGGASARNSVRRVLQSRVENWPEQIDILAMGHLHKFVALPLYPERVFSVGGGTFQKKGSEFANRISGAWDVGGVIVSYFLDADYTIKHVSAEFKGAT